MGRYKTAMESLELVIHSSTSAVPGFKWGGDDLASDEMECERSLPRDEG